MSRRQQDDNGDVRVPLSVVFITVGLIVLGTVGAIYALTPVAPPALPELIPLAKVPTLTPAPVSDTTAETDAGDGTGDAVLLPETPLQTTALPSEATAAEAPRAFRDPLPGQPVRIVIPSIGVDAPVWEVSVEAVPAGDDTAYQWRVPNTYAAGWHNDSARMGQSGNVVLNGHHNIYGEVFRDLVDLAAGAEIILYGPERSYVYQVQEQQLLLERGQPLEVRQENASWIAPTDEERLTLVTCWPYTDNSHRLIVVATPVQ